MSVWDDIADSREEAENLKLRAALIRAIRDRIEGAGWSQSIAAQMGIHVRVEVDADTVLSA
jgi:predicted XRE-type DNA-binding protein